MRRPWETFRARCRARRFVLTATPVRIDPFVLASKDEAIFEGSQIESALSRRCRYTQGAGSKDLLGVDAYHKAVATKTPRDGGRRAQADPRQTLQERDAAQRVAAKAP